MSLANDGGSPELTTAIAPEFFAGDGEMAHLMRDFDWSQTSLGPPEKWPQSLKTSVRIILTSRFSMWMAWGEDLVFFYNDAYRHDTLGLKHPWALGRKSSQVWAEIWSDLEPRIDRVLTDGIATWDEALRLVLERSGYPEETYHTFSYSPLADDNGVVSGMLCVVTEETERVIGQRRLELLRDLGDRIGNARTEQEVLLALKTSLDDRSEDVPFSLAYLFDGKQSAQLASSTGFPSKSEACPEKILLDDEHSIWPVQRALESTVQFLITDLEQKIAILPRGVWDVSPNEAVLVPIAQQGESTPAGFLILGINPYRPYDDDYAGFVDLVAGQLASGLANARAYEAQRLRAEELAKLDQAKTTFFSNVSHELRTPLTLMLGPLEDLLREPSLSSQERARVEIAHRNSLRLLKLVNTLLEFSRIEAGRIQANYEAVDLSLLTSEISSSFTSACEKAGLRLTVSCEDLGEPVYVDRTMWERVVLNLLSNAIKHTFAGEIEVALYHEGENAVLSVRDTGTGIPPEALPRLFERFYRVEGAQGRTHEGTGIGLALVQELVRLHGGQVAVTSELGKGSSFTVSLPLGAEHLPPERIVRSQVNPSKFDAGEAYVLEAQQWLREDDLALDEISNSKIEFDLKRPRIVLADDNTDLRDYLRKLLSPKYEVEAVSNGDEALEAVRRQPADLILTDVMMPVLDGFGLLKEVRDDIKLRETPVVMLSARAGEEAKVEGLEFGADDYLVKPFSARELLARVQSNLELANLRRLAAFREEKLRIAAEAAYERMRDFAESLPQMAAERDASGRLRWANERFFEYSGLHSSIYPTESEILELVHPDDQEKWTQSWQTMLTTGKNLNLETRLRRSDGEMRWWLFSSTSVIDDEGEIDRFYISGTDIHDQKEAEAELERKVEERTAELLAANREMEGFTYTVSHDLRSPLRSIIFNSAVLMEQMGETLAPEHRQILDRQIAAARKLATLIDDLLKHSRLSRQALVVAEVDASELVATVVRELDLPSHSSERINVQPGMSIHADPQLLQFVFMNLIQNACKFSPDGGEIQVGCRKVGSSTTFFVKDRGIGFDPVYSEKIFQPFERLVTEQEFPGTGIGLANVKRIVERHGGKVWADSQPGIGSTFYFTLESV